MALTDNLVAGYKLDDLTDSEGSYTLTNNNSVTFSAGIVGDAADYGTSNTNKSLSNASTLGITTGDITVSWWHKTPASLNNQLGIVQMMKNSGFSFGAWFDYGNNRVCGMNHNNTDCTGVGSFTPSTSTWYHFIVTRTSAGSCVLYIDNSSTHTWTNNLTGDADRFTIGENNRGDWQTDGMIDSTYVWNKIISSDERAEMYNGGAGYEIGGAAGPATLKTFNTIETASVKTIETVELASVKTINTAE